MIVKQKANFMNGEDVAVADSAKADDGEVDGSHIVHLEVVLAVRVVSLVVHVFVKREEDSALNEDSRQELD